MTYGFMSIETAAKWCDVSTKTIQRWIEQGLPKWQAGPRSKVLIRPEDIENFLTKGEKTEEDLGRLVEEVIQELRQ